MKLRILNWLLQNKFNKRFVCIVAIFVGVNNLTAQIANYVNNGGFEAFWSCTFPNEIRKVKYWRSVDSSQVTAPVFSTCYNNVPFNGHTYQYPRSGNAYAGIVVYCLNGSCSPEFNRSYIRNRLKNKLQQGKTYCIRFYVNLTTTSSYGVDGIGVLFTDNNSLDTITKVNMALTYFQPQISNLNGNIITDTLNWLAITGTFVATGNESNLVIGNFKSDANTNATVTNPNYLPIIESDFVIDDVSCIPLDLPAYAYTSNNVYAIPGNTLYLGRQRDVGIDEACMWYKLPNTTTAIDTAAGITITVAVTTETYMVKQDICGVIKYDTVVVHPSGAGVSENTLDWVKCKLVPNPANDQVEVTIDNADIRKSISRIIVLNSLGHKVYENSYYESDHISLNVSELPDGFYFIRLQLDEGNAFTRKLMISR